MADNLIDLARLQKIEEAIKAASALTPDDQAYLSKVIHVIAGLQFYSRNDDYIFDIFRLYQAVSGSKIVFN